MRRFLSRSGSPFNESSRRASRGTTTKNGWLLEKLIEHAIYLHYLLLLRGVKVQIFPLTPLQFPERPLLLGLARLAFAVLDYGANYFGRSNKKCECHTCETAKKGAFRKLKRGERKDRDLYIPEEEKKMVQVLPYLKCSMFLSTFPITNHFLL